MNMVHSIHSSPVYCQMNVFDRMVMNQINEINVAIQNAIAIEFRVLPKS